MKTIYLERHPKQSQTDGTLYMPSGREFYTLERPWLNNQEFRSCIPDGVYRLDQWVSPKFGDCYILSGGTVGKTKGQRTHILIHAANRVHELAGCVALGLSRQGDVLLNSAAAIKLFMQEMNGEPAMLFISGLEEHQ